MTTPTIRQSSRAHRREPFPASIAEVDFATTDRTAADRKRTAESIQAHQFHHREAALGSGGEPDGTLPVALRPGPYNGADLQLSGEDDVCDG